jgi:hypothetical protein
MDEMFSDAVSGYAEHGPRIEGAGQGPIGKHLMSESATPTDFPLSFAREGWA